MNEFISSILALLALVLFGILIVSLSVDRIEAKYKNQLNSVGIEKIVKCNNTQSNWYEIVWIKK